MRNWAQINKETEMRVFPAINHTYGGVAIFCSAEDRRTFLREIAEGDWFPAGPDEGCLVLSTEYDNKEGWVLTN